MAGDDKTIVFYSEFRDKKENITFYPIKEQQLVNSIKLGDKLSCEKAIKDMLSFRSESISSPARIKYRGYEIAMIMMSLLDGIDAEDEEKNAIYNMLENIEASKTIGDMADILTKMSERICMLVFSSGELPKESIAMRVKNIVHENYSNVNLSVSFIGDRLSLAANYLSRAFKEQSGEGLLDYIQKVRINMAKKLLEETDLTIEKIGEETGFSNSNSFQRVFKKMEGVTPGNYRRINKK